VSGYSFDNNGAPSLYSSQALAFDPEDHLTQIGPSGSASFKAGYSGGLRAWKETGGTRTYFLYSGGVPLIEMDVNGVVQAVNSFGAAGLLSRRTGGTGGPTTFYSFDPQGNVCQRLNSAAAVTSTDVYDAFGKGYRSPSVNDVYGFGGQWGYYHDYDTPLGLHLLSHRYLDTQTGRFLTRDPIGYAGGGNLYRFVGNSPTLFADPSGLVERGQYVAGGALLGAGTGAALGGGVPGAALLGVAFGHIGGSLYDSAEDFGLAWGCYEGGRAKLWQLLWSGTKASANVVGTATMLRAVGSASAPPPAAPPVAEPSVEEIPEIVIPRALYPESAAHIEEAQAAGHPTVLTIDRAGAAARRSQALRGIEKRAGFDRDEYPPAVFEEGGANSSVEYVPPSDNRGSGAHMGARLRRLPDRSKVRLRVQ
jgi:RHS repeat-associated protein